MVFMGHTNNVLMDMGTHHLFTTQKQQITKGKDHQDILFERTLFGIQL